LVRTANARYQESRDSTGVYGLRTADCGLRTTEVLGSPGKSLGAPGSPILIVYRGSRTRSVEKTKLFIVLINRVQSSSTARTLEYLT
jgi:hypothetical protein